MIYPPRSPRYWSAMLRWLLTCEAALRRISSPSSLHSYSIISPPMYLPIMHYPRRTPILSPNQFFRGWTEAKAASEEISSARTSTLPESQQSLPIPTWASMKWASRAQWPWNLPSLKLFVLRTNEGINHSPPLSSTPLLSASTHTPDCMRLCCEDLQSILVQRWLLTLRTGKSFPSNRETHSCQANEHSRMDTGWYATW